MNTRLEHFDFLRGLAILMVIAIHTFPSLKSATDIDIALRQILNVAVPLFLAISGFFLANKQLGTKSDYFAFLKKQLPRVYYPCLLWSLPYFFLTMMKGDNIIAYIILLLGCGYSIYYFIALIIQYYLLLPVIQNVTKRNGGGIFCFCISAVSVLIVTYIMQIQGISLPLIVYAGMSPLWLIFFFVGVYIGKKNDRSYSIGKYCLGFIISLILSYIESKYLMSFHGGGVGIKLSSFVCSYMAIMIVFSKTFENLILRQKLLKTIGVQFGKYSFGIYLSHIYIIEILSRLVDWQQLGWSFRWPLVCVLSFALIYIGEKILPKYSKLLGLR